MFFGESLAQPLLRLKAVTDSTTYTIGDRVDLRIEAETEAELDSLVPVLRDSLGSFEVLHKEQKEQRLWIVYLSTTDSGRVFVPPVTFVYTVQNDTTHYVAYTNPFFLTFRGLQVNPQGEIKDIKSPHSAPLEFADILPYLIALLVPGVVIAVWYYYRKKKRQQTIETTPVLIIPPHKEALAALRQLEEQKLWQQGLVKKYYSELTNILRLFFEKRWNIKALESTTDEILQQMKHIPEALLVWDALEQSLRRADLVKFAKHIPTPAENEQSITIAYDIVRAMTPRESQPTTETTEVSHAG